MKQMLYFFGGVLLAAILIFSSTGLTQNNARQDLIEQINKVSKEIKLDLMQIDADGSKLSDAVNHFYRKGFITDEEASKIAAFVNITSFYSSLAWVKFIEGHEVEGMEALTKARTEVIAGINALKALIQKKSF
jgi:hypothetical protein